MQIKVKKLSANAVLPFYGSEGAACFDICCLKGGVVKAGESAVFDTGLSVEVPAGYAMFLYSRSGHGFKNGIRLANTTGIIDSDYRGEIRIKLHNDSQVDYVVSDGERLVQGQVVEAPVVKFVEVEELTETERGAGGFGSTGKN